MQDLDYDSDLADTARALRLKNEYELKPSRVKDQQKRGRLWPSVRLASGALDLGIAWDPKPGGRVGSQTLRAHE